MLASDTNIDGPRPSALLQLYWACCLREEDEEKLHLHMVSTPTVLFQVKHHQKIADSEMYLPARPLEPFAVDGA